MFYRFYRKSYNSSNDKLLNGELNPKTVFIQNESRNVSKHKQVKEDQNHLVGIAWPPASIRINNECVSIMAFDGLLKEVIVMVISPVVLDKVVFLNFVGAGCSSRHVDDLVSEKTGQMDCFHVV